MTTKAKAKTKSINKLKARNAKVAARLQNAVQPLNDRLKPMSMMVWWDGEEYRFNATAADNSTGNLFRLGDHGLEQLMAMTDRKLETFLKDF